LSRKENFRKIGRIAMFLVLTVMMFSCSTKKNTPFRRTFHNLNTHYNGYWNGRESFRQGVNELEFNARENYSFVLPVVYYGDKQEAASLAPYMDKAIEKASIMIQRHSMVFDKKEQVKWIDDCYLLIGQAYFYKKEYLKARRTFEYVTKTYTPAIGAEAQLWMIRAYNQMGEFEKSLTLLQQLQPLIDQHQVPVSVIRLFPLVYAEYYLMQDRYAESKKHLENAIIFNRNRDLKTRLTYILAQIYQQEGDLELATEYFGRVIKRNPGYEMSFNARINLAQSYDAEKGNKSMVLKQLNKLLNDPKNEDYNDQIYYALAEIARRDKDTALFKENLIRSVASSTDNNYQRSKSSLELAGIYFNAQDYPNAQAYYDTAMQSIPDDYPNIITLRKTTSMLTELVENLVEVQTQDSLQRLAALPETERMAVISKLIKKIEEEERRRAEAERQRQQQVMQARMDQMQNRQMQNRPGMGGASWYFYNPQTVSFGMTEFQKRWGDRELEDLWRLSNKFVVDFGSFPDEEGAVADSLASDTIKRAVDPKDPQTYLQDIPLTEEQMKASDKKIENALFNAGFIYYEGLNDIAESIQCFQQLIERYPQSDNRLLSLYMLYKLSNDSGEGALAERYKNRILTEFPDTDYAKIIRDPEYNKTLLDALNKKAALYRETYMAYKDGMHSLVFIYANDGINNYPEDEFTPKFKYLKAMAFGAKQQQDSLVAGLQEIVLKYPNSDVTPLAQNILLQMFNPDLVLGEEKEVTDTIAQEVKELAELYKYNPESQHFYVLVVDGSKINVNATKVKVSDFNSKFYQLDKLSVSSVILQDKMQMITVSSFAGATEALNFMESIVSNEYVFSQLSTSGYFHFVISAVNYPVFYKNKNLDAYLMFYNQNYQTK